MMHVEWNPSFHICINPRESDSSSLPMNCLELLWTPSSLLSFPQGSQILFFSSHISGEQVVLVMETFGLKLMFWMVSRHFVAAPDPLQKFVSGCI